MSNLTFAEARDEIHTLFKTAWDLGAETAGQAVLYADSKTQVPKTDDTDSNPDLWARITVQHTGGNQGTLGGNKCFNRFGLVTVQVFTPSGTGLSLGDNVYKIVVDAYEGKTTPGGVWFRNVSVNEIGPEGEWYQTNIIAEFEYEEQK
jgi:hypothetical protein